MIIYYLSLTNLSSDKMVNKREQERKEHENLEVKKYWLALKTCWYICVCVSVKITPHIFMGSHVAGFSFSRFLLI